MRKFITRTLIFSLPILLLLILMEFLLREIPNDYLFKRKYLDNHSQEIEILILGSSYSFFDINPIYFSNKTFNASHISQSLDLDLKIFGKYHDSFKNLKTIVLSISYLTLFDKLETSPEYWRIKNYIIYYHLKLPVSINYHSEILSNRFDVNLKRLGLYYLKETSNISCTETGWGISYKLKDPRDLKETGKEAALRHTHENLKVLADNTAILKSIIQLCERNRINILLFTPPAFETYRQNINNDQLKKTIETARELAKEHSNCRYINLFESNDFKAIDFYDADHLNEIGAKKFSIMINDSIKNWK